MAIARSTESGTWLLWSTSLLKNILLYLLHKVSPHGVNYPGYCNLPQVVDHLFLCKALTFRFSQFPRVHWSWYEGQKKLKMMSRCQVDGDDQAKIWTGSETIPSLFKSTILKIDMILIDVEKLIDYRLQPVKFLISPTWVSQTCFESWHLREVEHLQKWKHFRIKTAEKAYLTWTFFATDQN